MAQKVVKNKLLMGAGVAAVTVLAAAGIFAVHSYLASGQQQRTQTVSTAQHLKTPVNSQSILDAVSKRGSKGNSKPKVTDLKTLSKNAYERQEFVENLERQVKKFKSVTTAGENLKSSIEQLVKSLKAETEVDIDKLQKKLKKEAIATEVAKLAKQSVIDEKSGKESLEKAASEYKKSLKDAINILSAAPTQTSSQMVNAIKEATADFTSHIERLPRLLASKFSVPDKVIMRDLMSDIEKTCADETAKARREFIKAIVNLTNNPLQEIIKLKKESTDQAAKINGNAVHSDWQTWFDGLDMQRILNLVKVYKQLEEISVLFAEDDSSNVNNIKERVTSAKTYLSNTVSELNGIITPLAASVANAAQKTKCQNIIDLLSSAAGISI